MPSSHRHQIMCSIPTNGRAMRHEYINSLWDEIPLVQARLASRQVEGPLPKLRLPLYAQQDGPVASTFIHYIKIALLQSSFILQAKCMRCGLTMVNHTQWSRRLAPLSPPDTCSWSAVGEGAQVQSLWESAPCRLHSRQTSTAIPSGVHAVTQVRRSVHGCRQLRVCVCVEGCLKKTTGPFETSHCIHGNFTV